MDPGLEAVEFGSGVLVARGRWGVRGRPWRSAGEWARPSSPLVPGARCPQLVFTNTTKVLWDFVVRKDYYCLLKMCFLFFSVLY